MFISCKDIRNCVKKCYKKVTIRTKHNLKTGVLFSIYNTELKIVPISVTLIISWLMYTFGL